MRTYRVFNVLTTCRKTHPVKHINRTYSFSTNSFENPNELSGEQKFSCDYIVVKYFTFACKLNRIYIYSYIVKTENRLHYIVSNESDRSHRKHIQNKFRY